MANGTIRRLVTVVISWAPVGLIPSESFADSLNLTTWYPAPYGVYSKLRSTQDAYFAYQGGSVGIGTNQPTELLTLGNWGAATSRRAMQFGNGGWGDPVAGGSGNSNGDKIIFEDNSPNIYQRTVIGLGTANDLWAQAGVTSGNAPAFRWFNGSATELVRITGIGDLRIGSSAALDAPSRLAVVQTGTGIQDALNIASQTDGLGNGVAMNWVMGKPGYNQEIEGKISAVLSGPYGNASDSNLVFYVRGGNTLNEAIRVMNYGNVALGTSHPQNVSLDIETNNTGNGAGLVVGGTCVSGYCPSDERLKENISHLSASLETILKLKPASFRFKGRKDGSSYGLIAQEVREAAPELVHEGADGYLGVDYSPLEMMLIRAVQEQQAKIDSQGTEIRSLRLELKALRDGHTGY